MGHGLVAELLVQCRLTEPTALYDMPEWATRYGITGLYPALTAAGQLNDDRVGRLLDVLYAQRAVIWGELIGRAARLYGVDFRRCTPIARRSSLRGVCGASGKRRRAALGTRL